MQTFVPCLSPEFSSGTARVPDDRFGLSVEVKLPRVFGRPAFQLVGDSVCIEGRRLLTRNGLACVVFPDGSKTWVSESKLLNPAA